MLSDLFWRKLKLEMRLVHVVEKRPHKKIKLDPLSEEQLSIEKEVVGAWSQDNLELYQELLKNGMAEFICNRDFLFEFYRTLNFTHQKIETLDQSTERFKNLHTLDLSQNRISSVKHLPPHCRKLYLDFNKVSSFQLQRTHRLEFLSVSHNCLDDHSVQNIVSTFPELRCLNCSHNSICSLKQFVTLLGALHLLKILISFENPISMLSIYYSYVTEHLLLSYFDGSKYIKEEPKVQEPPPPLEKQVKEDNKQGKKNAKKGAKVEQKLPEEPPQEKEIPKPVKRELTAEDFSKVKISVTIGNLQEHSGTVFDANIFPPEVDPLLTQTCYWVKYELMGEAKEDREHKIGFDASTFQNGEVRLDLRCTINKEFSINPENHILFNQGLKVIVMQAEPKMKKDPDTLQFKPEISQGVPEIQQFVLGAIRIDFRTIHLQKEKSLSFKFKIFPIDAVESPLFYDPFQNELEIIQSKKDEFEEILRMEEEERLRKAQEEEQQQTQKKGKDQKKVDKKTGKKDGKQSAQADKPRSEACPFPVFDRYYSVIENNKMFKGKELVCLKVAFE